MVRRLCQLVKDADLASGVGCGGEDGLPEQFFRHHLRAREGEDDAAGFDHFDAFPV